MIYQDKVYGQVQIKDKIIIEIMKSPELQRLRGILQFGPPTAVKKIVTHSRFSHSLGVYLLLARFNAPREEKIAGLIHDVSHSAFSHNIDYVLKNASGKTQSHQDNIFEDFVKKSSLPKILKKYKIDLNHILNEKNFPLLENKLPDLCADRIDYCLRDLRQTKEISRKQVDYFLNNLTVIDGKWIFINLFAAQKFSNLFFKMNKIHWSGLYSAKIFKSVGEYLKYALNRNYINFNDLYSTDYLVIKKINNHLKQDIILQKLFRRARNKTNFVANIKNKKYEVYCKSRIVDPLVMVEDTIRRLSEINKHWKQVVKQELKPKKYYIKFI